MDLQPPRLATPSLVACKPPLNMVLCARQRGMNWDAIGAIAELLGSVGVLATLIYIAFQVRDAKSMNILETSRSMTDNVAGRVIDNPHLAEILAKIDDKTSQKLPASQAAIDEWGLTPVEAEIWARYMGTVWRGFDARARAGNTDVGTLQTFMVSRQARIYLNVTQARYSQELRDDIERIEPGYFEAGI